MKLDVDFSALHKAVEPMKEASHADAAIATYMRVHVSQLKKQPEKVQRAWHIGQELYHKKKRTTEGS